MHNNHFKKYTIRYGLYWESNGFLNHLSAVFLSHRSKSICRHQISGKSNIYSLVHTYISCMYIKIWPALFSCSHRFEIHHPFALLPTNWFILQINWLVSPWLKHWVNLFLWEEKTKPKIISALQLNSKKWMINDHFRSSRSQMFFKISVLKNFANFTRKHLCCSLFLLKLQALRPFKNTFFTELLQWLL